MLVKHICSSRI